MSDRPVVILTALNLEYDAVRKKLEGLQVHRHAAGTRFEVGHLAGNPCRVVLGIVGKGNHPAAVLAERAITEFKPAAVIFSGVAGALWPEIALGDLVVATHVYAYHGGTSEDDGLKARPRAWEIAHGPDQIARHLARSREWARHLPAGSEVPQVLFGPIAAGEVVQDSAISDHARWVRTHYNDALAIEMEAAGVAQAGHLNNSLPVIVVRGISDRADGTKAVTDGASWQPRAAANAAAFAVALAAELADEADGIQSTRSQAMTGSTNNLAMGHARVGVQAGQIFGNVSIGREHEGTSDLATEIAAFREQLKKAHRAGKLDDASYLAAETELDVATDSLAQDDPQAKGAVMVALKRLRGLIADVAELAAGVGAMISLLQAAS